MKKLELKNLKVSKLTKQEKSKVSGGTIPRTSTPCNKASTWPVTCTTSPVNW